MRNLQVTQLCPNDPWARDAYLRCIVVLSGLHDYRIPDIVMAYLTIVPLRHAPLGQDVGVEHLLDPPVVAVLTLNVLYLEVVTAATETRRTLLKGQREGGGGSRKSWDVAGAGQDPQPLFKMCLFVGGWGWGWGGGGTPTLHKEEGGGG